jgi:mannose-1-phosphate guanylyltransferase
VNRVGKKSQSNIRPVLLAGGAGNRLKDMNNASLLPKQFHKLNGGKGASLVEATLERVSSRDYFKRAFIFTHSDYKACLSGLDALIYFEPIRKNTFMPVFIAAMLAQRRNDEFILVLPCDHVIKDHNAFRSAILEGANQAYTTGGIIYYGIEPHYAETQFGYVSQNGDGGILFHEKPSFVDAGVLIEQGALWNSGIFLIPVNSFVDYVQLIAPELYGLALQYELESADLPSELWEAAPDISFDRFYCERNREGILIKVGFDWCDIGAPERYIQSGVAAA